MLLPHCISMLMLFLSLSLVGCSYPSSIFTTFLTYNFPILICCILFLFLLSTPDVIILMLSNFYSSQMLEFDDSWKLVAISLLQVSSQTKNLLLTFFPFSDDWRILPSTNYGFPIVWWNFFSWDLCLNFVIPDEPPCYVQQCWVCKS